MICRLCLKLLCEESAIYLFETDETIAETKLVKVIAKFLQLEIMRDDAVSTSICTGCCEHLEDFNAFWQLVEQKQGTLQKEFVTVDCGALKWSPQLDNDLALQLNTDAEIDEKPLDLNMIDLPVVVMSAECETMATAAIEKQALTNCKQAQATSEEEFAAAKFTESTDDELPLKSLMHKLKTKRKTKKRHTLHVVSKITSCELNELLDANNKRQGQSRRQKSKAKADSESEVDFDDLLDHKTKGVSKTVLSRRYEELIASYMQSNCDLCDFSTTYYSELRTHFHEVHKRSAYLKCCNRVFSRPSKMMDHIRKHINPDVFKCTICQKSLSSQFYLQTHMETIHNKTDTANLTTYACNKCDKLFSSRKRLDNHMAKHDNDQLRYDCELCGKSFANVHRLRRHIQSIHEDLHPHVCDTCGKKFKFKPSFERHLLEHQGVYAQPMQCQICGVWLKNEHSLRLHAFTHDNVNTSCEHCSKVCSSRTALRAHIKYAHRLQLNLQCTYCQKTFKQQRNLEEHMAIHTGSQLYTCPHCPKECRSRSNMYVHIKQRHAEEWLRAKMARSHNPNDKSLD